MVYNGSENIMNYSFSRSPLGSQCLKCCAGIGRKCFVSGHQDVTKVCSLREQASSLMPARPLAVGVWPR